MNTLLLLCQNLTIYQSAIIGIQYLIILIVEHLYKARVNAPDIAIDLSINDSLTTQRYLNKLFKIEYLSTFNIKLFIFQL